MALWLLSSAFVNFRSAPFCHAWLSITFVSFPFVLFRFVFFLPKSVLCEPAFSPFGLPTQI